MPTIPPDKVKLLTLSINQILTDSSDVLNGINSFSIIAGLESLQSLLKCYVLLARAASLPICCCLLMCYFSDCLLLLAAVQKLPDVGMMMANSVIQTIVPTFTMVVGSHVFTIYIPKQDWNRRKPLLSEVSKQRSKDRVYLAF